MANLNLHGNVSDNERALYAAWKSLLSFGKLFLSKDFLKSETPQVHIEICDELDSNSTKPLCIILPRDSAKSVITRAKFIQALCFAKKAKEWGFTKQEQNLFIGWVASNQRKSKRNIRYVRHHIKRNPAIRYFFGDGYTIIGDIDNQEEVNTKWQDSIISSSNLASMRGDADVSVFGETVRYSMVACDDAESEQNTVTDTARENIRNNILKGILPAIEHNPGNRLIVDGTPVHYDSFIQRMLDAWINAVKEAGGSNPLYFTNDIEELAARQRAREKMAWHIIAYKSTQPVLTGGVLWHSFIPRTLLNNKLAIAKEAGDIAGYYQERELEVQSDEVALFGRKYIKYWKGYYTYQDGISYVVIDGVRKPVLTFGGSDPATDIDKKSSDFSTVGAAAVDENNIAYVLEYIRERGIPTLGMRDKDNNFMGKKGVVDYIVEFNDKYHLEQTTVEDVAMTRSVFQDLNRVRMQKNRFDIIVIPHAPGGQNKHNRIYTYLNGRFAVGGILIGENHHELEDEIVKFGPKMAHDDLMDFLYYALRNARPYTADKIEDKDQRRIRKKKTIKAKSWQGA